MLLAINGATTMKATLPQDIAAAAAAGFRALEIWAAKMDAYLESHSIMIIHSEGSRVGLDFHEDCIHVLPEEY
jgi:hypothetical protein